MRRELEERVSGMVLISDMEDKLCWANDKNKEFLVKKCSELLILDGGVDVNFAYDKFWKLKVPPRVRSFLWMLAIDRIPSKEFLVKIGVNFHDISVDGFEDFFALRNKVKMARIRKSFWLILISVACWTVWLARNGLVFESRKDNFWWICLNKCRIDTIISNSAASFWRPPPHGWLKFNVCGVAKEDRAVYGGVLRDKEGLARALFSSSVVANDVDMAKTGAVKIALKVMRPWSLQAIFAGIHRDMLKARNVVFSVADEKGNELASSLLDCITTQNQQPATAKTSSSYRAQLILLG
ncbi:hypothetical protein Goarm_012375, partial [Gossypium armourianum]|nr:hypothetical protein [Gossypium armourianum]